MFGDFFGLGSLFGTLIGLATLVLAILAIVSIAQAKKSTVDTLIWVVVVLVFPLLGAIVWFVIGRTMTISR